MAVLVAAALAAAWLAFDQQAVKVSAPLEARDTGPRVGGSSAADAWNRTADTRDGWAEREGETTRAEAALSDWARRLKHLDSVTVRFGSTPQDEEAVAYYVDGEILIDEDHTVDVETIIAHEVWHIVDWRDNGRLDWGEDLPPDAANEYYR